VITLLLDDYYYNAIPKKGLSWLHYEKMQFTQNICYMHVMIFPYQTVIKEIIISGVHSTTFFPSIMKDNYVG